MQYHAAMRMKLKQYTVGLTLLLQVGLCWAAAPLKIYSIESKPISFVNDGRPDGLVIDLIHAVQDRLGQREAIDIVPWARARSISLTSPNVMVLPVARTPERERDLVFVGPVFSTRVTAYALKGKPAEWARTHQDLRQLRGGGRRGSIFVSQPRERGYNITDETNNSDIAARMLINGRFDLWFDAQELMPQTVRGIGYNPDQLEVAVQMPSEPIYFAFSKGTPPATVRAWSDALRDMKRDGSFLKIYRKWLPNSQLPPDLAPQH